MMLSLIKLGNILLIFHITFKYSSAQLESTQCSVTDSMRCSVNTSCLQISDMPTILKCPVMFQCDNSTTCRCTGYPEWIIACNENLLTARAVDCSCVMYDSRRIDIVAGYCLAQCGSKRKRSADDEAYYDLPQNVHSLNSTACKQWNRQGLLCGQCKKGFYPQPYSYSYKCLSEHYCKGKDGVWKYLLVAYGPLTVFYFTIILLRVNVTSSYLLPFAIFGQTLTSPYILRPIIYLASQNTVASVSVNVLTILYAVWSLDFNRNAYSICLKLDPLTVIALEYGIALYPLLLHYVTYRLIKLHDRRIPILVRLWRPIKIVLSVFLENVDSRTTVIDAFATFFLLSYSKILTISFTLLVPAKLYSIYSREYRLVLFNDGAKDYLQKEHLPYAIVAIILCVTLNITPFIMLLIFHTKHFQKLLTYFSCKCLAIRAIMDTLQSCYKDGTEPGTRDCRWFSAAFPAYWIVTYFVYAITQDAMGYIYAIIVCVVFMLITAIVQPYNKKHQHLLYMHYALFSLLTTFFLLLVSISLDPLEEYNLFTKILIIVLFVIASLPQVLLMAYTIHWFYIHCKRKVKFHC